MAIAPKIDDKKDSSGYVAASYCDRNRLYIQFAMDIDADMPPLAADFSVQRDKQRIKTQSIDVQINDQQSMVILVMDDTFLPGEELELCYKPTQWLMCELESGDAIDVFDEAIFPKPLDALEPSLRLLTKFEPTLAPENLTHDTRSVKVRFATEFRVQLYFQIELDTAIALDVDDFRAETKDRWIRITGVRHVPARAKAKAEILLELSEPLGAGTQLSIGYRSPQNRLRSVDSVAVAPFTIKCVFAETDDEQLQHLVENFEAELPELSDIVERGRGELAGHSDADLLDDSLDDEASLDQGDFDDFDELDDQVEEVDEPKPEPVVKKPVVVRAKTINEESLKPATKVNSVKDPAIAAAIAEKAERIRNSMQAAGDSDVKPELSMFAKAIYFVPIFVLGWLIFIVCVYLATIVFDISVPSIGGISGSSEQANTAPQVQAQNLSREKCSLKSEDGSTYEGECLGGERDGFGSYVWASGNRYDGEWRNGRRHGQGTLVYSSGAVYKGEYRDGKEHGQGTMVWPNGANYEGEYKDGRFDGRGNYVSAEGNRFEGTFKDGSMTQDGTCILKSGEQYPGPCQS